jgi:undecaprenyl-diphosphatase
LFFEKEIDLLFAGNITLVAMMLLVTGLLLFMADRSPKEGKPLTFFNAFAVGIAQAIAILPGISRSGATIASSITLGIDRAQAARFSFLMVVPLILGKVAKDLLSGEFSLANQAIMPLLLGFLASFVVGLLACTWMLNLVRRGKLVYFSLYCWIVGGGALIWLYLK